MVPFTNISSKDSKNDKAGNELEGMWLPNLILNECMRRPTWLQHCDWDAVGACCRIGFHLGLALHLRNVPSLECFRKLAFVREALLWVQAEV